MPDLYDILTLAAAHGWTAAEAARELQGNDSDLDDALMEGDE